MGKQTSLSDQYRIMGVGSTGSPEGNSLYQKGIQMGIVSEKYDQENYIYYYTFREHKKKYERRGYKYFERAAVLFKRAAQEGHDLATMNYALYLYEFKNQVEESLPWFFKASELGLAVADFQLSYLYKEGCKGLEADQEKSEFYLSQYRKRMEENERQRVLAGKIDEDAGGLGRIHLFDWFCGKSYFGGRIADAPYAIPSKWRWGI